MGDHAHYGYGCSGKEVCRMWDNLINACRENHQVNITFFLVFILMVHISTIYICQVSMLNIQVLPTRTLRQFPLNIFWTLFISWNLLCKHWPMFFLPLNILHPMVGCKVGCGGSLLLCCIGNTQQHKILTNTGNVRFYSGHDGKELAIHCWMILFHRWEFCVSVLICSEK